MDSETAGRGREEGREAMRREGCTRRKCRPAMRSGAHTDSAAAALPPRPESPGAIRPLPPPKLLAHFAALLGAPICLLLLAPGTLFPGVCTAS